mgnify:CR=1 FL=1
MNGWTEVESQDWDIGFFKPSIEDEIMVNYLRKRGKIINRYPGIKGLFHKDQFKKQMKICSDINPKAFDFVPQTFIYPLEQIKLKEYIKSHPGCCLIAKPSNGLKGKDIFLMRDM